MLTARSETYGRRGAGSSVTKLTTSAAGRRHPQHRGMPRPEPVVDTSPCPGAAPDARFRNARLPLARIFHRPAVEHQGRGVPVVRR